ncbi:MAG TPA: BA14K family protein [Brevundimonas sp.]|jgi:hypothetical protein
MRKLLIAAAAGLMTLSALPATAGAAQERPYNAGPMSGQNHGGQNHGGSNQNGPGHNNSGPNRPGQGRPDQAGPNRPGQSSQYGNWDDRWGARPSAPPRGWGRNNDWYRHVRACSQRYRSYNPRTDTFVVRRGVAARCRL